MELNKERCDCGKIATWLYMPGYSEGGNPYSCQKCVFKGCSCNWKPVEYCGLPVGIEGKDFKWISEDTWVHLDENGEEYPCCEYEYEKEGFEIENAEEKI